MIKARLAATVTTRPSVDGSELAVLPSEVTLLELRADLAGEVSAAWLRQQGSARAMYSLRSCEAGGLFDGSRIERHQRLVRAAEHFDLVELEGPGDVTPSVLQRIPAEKRVISWHAAAADPQVLHRRFTELSATPARYYRFSCPCEQLGQATVPLRFLRSLGRTDVIAYATGAAGDWASVLAPSFGSPVVFGTVSDRLDVHQGLSVTCLANDYDLPRVRTYRELYGIVGDPVSHSLSPRIHNTAYRATGQRAIFVPLQVEDFTSFWRSFIAQSRLTDLGLTAKGFTVASPHKESSSRIPGEKSEIVRMARSSNLCYLRDGRWRMDTSDPDGVLDNLRTQSVRLTNCKVAVVGGGGSGRAITAALKDAGAQVTMFNRNIERGRRATQLLGVPFAPLAEFQAEAFSVVVNATPVGRDGLNCPFEPDRLQPGTIVVDHVYGSKVTRLVEVARARGLTTFDGGDVLSTQAARQFHAMTGQHMPRGLTEQIVGCLVSPSARPIGTRGDHPSTTVQDSQ